MKLLESIKHWIRSIPSLLEDQHPLYYLQQDMIKVAGDATSDETHVFAAKWVLAQERERYIVFIDVEELEAIYIELLQFKKHELIQVRYPTGYCELYDRKGRVYDTRTYERL